MSRSPSYARRRDGLLGRRLAATLVAGVLLSGTARAEEWFDAYARGLEALKKRDGPKAAELFERAIRKNPDPGENLITYGTNRIDKYHPYLRLAEAHLLYGNLESARDALRRSEQRGKEPAAERVWVAGLVDAAAEKARAAAVAPPPPPLVAATPTPPTTLAAAVPPTQPRVPAPTAAPTTAPSATNGTLDLQSDPPGASVLLAGRLLGTTPLKIDLSPGIYPVTLHREGTADQAFSVRIEAGRRTTETRALVSTATPPPTATPAPEVASLVVYSQPPGATVYLDDELLGATAPGSGRLVKSSVAPGAHRVRLALAGHADVAQEVEVAPSGPTILRAGLAPAAATPVGLAPLVGGAAVVLLAGAAVFVWRRRRGAEAPGTVVLPRTGRPATGPGRTVAARSKTGRGVVATAVSPPTLEPLTTARETQALVMDATKPAPETFGEYRLLKPLGKGGMAWVFLAERNGEECALKRPLPAFLEDPEFMERFLREAEIGRTLHHPNIIRIFERGQVGRTPYFTMELIRGETLSDHVRTNGPLDARSAAKVIVQVAEALDYAHLKGIVHRDLKPSNIMILEDGTVKVMDYGIARARRFEGLTVTGAFLGTPDYVAPETAEGKGTDARSDLYSLGIVFYEIVTGKKPFVGETPFATLSKHVSEPPTPPSVIAPGLPRELEAIILKLLRKDPAERHPGAEELLIELRDYLNRAA